MVAHCSNEEKNTGDGQGLCGGGGGGGERAGTWFRSRKQLGSGSEQREKERTCVSSFFPIFLFSPFFLSLFFSFLNFKTGNNWI